MPKINNIKPQPKQLEFLNSNADITLYGGSAGGGKSSALLMRPLQCSHIKGFNSIIFRKSYTDITNPGGLLDISKEFYTGIGKLTGYDKWKIQESVVKFHYLQHDKDLESHQGAQYAMIGFDELTHFTEKQFWYMLSRNRSTSGVKPFVDATCNPDAESWVVKLVEHYIDDNGFAIPEMSGKIIYLKKDDLTYTWSETPKDGYLSFTFIQSSLEDNLKLISKDPNYKIRLEQLNRVDRERLLRGNWKIRKEAGELFKRNWFEVVDKVPKGKTVRYWDLASTEVSKSNKDPDYSVGVKMLISDGVYYVIDVQRFRESPYETTKRVKSIIKQDNCLSYIEQEGGSAAKREMNAFIKSLAGYDIRADKPMLGKVKRAETYSAQAEAGNVKIIRADWNDQYLNELVGFPDGSHDDQVDASTGAFNKLTSRGWGAAI